MECIVREDIALIYKKYTGRDQETLSQIKEKRKRAEENRKVVNSRMDPYGQLKLTELCGRSQTLPPEADLPMAGTPL